MKLTLPETTKEEFIRVLGASQNEEALLTPKIFAICRNTPDKDERRARLATVWKVAQNLGLSRDTMNLWYADNLEEMEKGPVVYLYQALNGYSPGDLPCPVALNYIAPQTVPWLVPGALARGEITLLGADGGTGKGLVEAMLVAALTKGTPCGLFEPKSPCGAGTSSVTLARDSFPKGEASAAAGFTPSVACGDTSPRGGKLTEQLRGNDSFPSSSSHLGPPWGAGANAPEGVTRAPQGPSPMGKVADAEGGRRMRSPSDVGEGTPSHILIFPGEDDASRVLRPRLAAAGADLSRVQVMTPTLFYERTGSYLTMDSDAFQSYLLEASPRPDLVIIDPLQSFLPPSVDMARRNQMRACLTPFQSACEKIGAAGLIAMHTNKKSGVSGRQRLADSSDIWDMSRVVFMMGTDPQQKGTVYLSNEKNNYAAPLKTALLEISDAEADGVRTAAARVVGFTDRRDADFAAVRAARQAVKKSDVQAAILDALNGAPTASMESERLRKSVMEETGCSETTYKRARCELKDAGTIHTHKLRKKDGSDAWYTFRYSTQTEQPSSSRVSASTAVI